MSSRFALVRLVFSSGERLPVLVDAQSGIPPRLALLFTLEERSRGGSARLEAILRRLRDLYEWCSTAEIPLEDALMRSEFIAPRVLLRAHQEVQDASTSTNCEGEEHRSSSLFLSNARISAWIAYMRFAVVRDNWQSGEHKIETAESRMARRYYLDDLTTLLGARRLRLPGVRSHEPLSCAELIAIDSVLQVKTGGIFAPAALERNVLLFQTIRCTGMRIGEALKIKIEDLPDELKPGDQLIAGITGQPQLLTVRRRPDDPEDNRKREARVKRGDRRVPIPDALASALRRYAKKRRRGASNYLFISSTDPSNALSQSRAEKIIKSIGRHAHNAFVESRRGANSTLEKLCWHRLRTTRACEMAFETFKGGRALEHQKQEFIAFFGWTSLESAEPYLRRVREHYAKEQNFQIIDGLFPPA